MNRSGQRWQKIIGHQPTGCHPHLSSAALGLSSCDAVVMRAEEPTLRYPFSRTYTCSGGKGWDSEGWRTHRCVNSVYVASCAADVAWQCCLFFCLLCCRLQRWPEFPQTLAAWSGRSSCLACPDVLALRTPAVYSALL